MVEAVGGVAALEAAGEVSEDLAEDQAAVVDLAEVGEGEEYGAIQKKIT